MAEITHLSVAHLVSPEPVHLRCNDLLDMLERDLAFERAALTFLDKDNHETNKTYRHLLEGARVVANFLRNRGLRKGDKVLILLLGSEDFLDSFFGTILAGGIPVTASPPMTFGDISKYISNLTHIVANSESRFMITFPRIKKIIGNVLAGNNQIKDFILFKEIVAEPPKTPGYPSIDSAAPAFLQYTSGSTGMPKGAVLSHRAVLSNCHGIARGLEVGEQDVGVSWLPLFHDMGLIGGVLTSLYARLRLVVMLPESFMMDPMSWLKNMSRYRCTAAVAPNFAYHLCAHRATDEDVADLDLGSLKVALNGAEPVDLRTLQLFEDRFKPCGLRSTVAFPVYGMAENCLAATFPKVNQRFEVEPMDRRALEADFEARPADPRDSFPFQAVSVGAPLAGQELAIQGQAGGFARELQVGEILIKSPSLMSGYYRNEAETAEAIRDGWLHTGDLGFVSRGRLFITGRAKELIIKRGRNYYPYDIERAASGVDGVRKGCLTAFSVPSAANGTEDLVLVIETRETDPTAKARIEQAIAAEVMGSVGIKPDRITLVPPRTIPKTSSGKLQRLLCRQRYLEGTLVKGMSDRWLAPVKTLVSSFIGHQRFRLRARSP
jgi:acyl-CoA synthetase (AMP-forming)/AMP-acid ligase II